MNQDTSTHTEIDLSPVITQSGKLFLKYYQILCENLQTLSLNSEFDERKAKKLSRTITDIVNFFGSLKTEISTNSVKATILFEINFVLEGDNLKNSSNLLSIESNHELKRIFIDLLALTQKYLLVPRAKLAKLPVGITNFYEIWNNRLKGQQSEYQCLLNDTSDLIKISSTKISNDAKKSVLKQIGEVLSSLGIDDVRAKSFVKNFKPNTISENMISGELLMNLQVIASSSNGFTDGTINNELYRAIRFWSTQDPFVKFIFKGWDIYRPFDYTKIIDQEDHKHFTQKSKLYKSWINESSKLDLTDSFIDAVSKGQQFFKKIPILVIGHEEVGKSSYYMALHNSVLQGKIGGLFSSGMGLRQLYSNNEENWINQKEIIANDKFVEIEWKRQETVGILNYDYDGSETEPIISDAFKNGQADENEKEQANGDDKPITRGWSEDFQKKCKDARGLIFMIDAKDINDPRRLRSRLGWFKNIIDFWSNNNPEAQHMPIALMINQCDLIFDKIPSRTFLLPKNFQPAVIENGSLAERGKSDLFDKTSLNRLKDCLLFNPENNSSPQMQQMIETILDSIDNFFNRILQLTYNYQIFLTSSKPPNTWGIIEPVNWISEILEQKHFQESIILFNIEEREIHKEIERYEAINKNLLEYANQIDTSKKEEKEIAQKSYMPGISSIRGKKKNHIIDRRKTAERLFKEEVKDLLGQDFVEKPHGEILEIMREKINLSKSNLEKLNLNIRKYKKLKKSSAMY